MLKLSAVIYMKLQEIFVFILLIIYIGLPILVTVLDKLFAIHKKYRIKERTLLIIGTFCSTVAMYVTMRIMRHKTLHNKFMYGLPLILLLKIVLLVIIYTYLK